MRPPFPARWGQPPRALTKDLVHLPGKYGRGSGTLRKWILEKMAEDRAAAAAAKNSTAGNGKTCPERDLVGMTGDDAKAAVLAEFSELAPQNVHILPHDAIVTHDYREDRVRIFVGDDGKVARQPIIG